MCKRIGLLLALLAISVPSSAQVGGSKGGGSGGSVTVQEEDGSPTGTASTLKFPNGSVTSNGGGSYSIAATGTPSDATYITQTANGSLSAEQALGALSTGCLGSATTTGVVSARTITGTANQISIANGDCSGNPTISIPSSPTLPGTVSATAFTATGASTGIVQMNGITSGAFKLTTPDATGQTVTLQPAAQTSGAATFILQDAAGVNQTVATLAQAQALTNKTIDCSTAGNVCTITHHKEFDLASSSGGVASHIWNEDPLSTTCTPTSVVGTNRAMGVCTFPDSDGDYGRQISFDLPVGYVSGSLKAIVTWKTTGTGNARFQIQTKCYADDEADDAAFNTASVVTAAAGTSARPNKQDTGAITDTGCAGDELLRVRFFRNRTEASDTLNAALDVEKVHFYYTEAQ